MSVPRFAAVGLANTAIDYGLYAGLFAAGLPAQLANLVSVATAAGFSFLANRNFTFAARKDATPLIRQMLRHATTTGSALIISAVVIHFAAPVIGALLAKAIAIPLSFAWNYGLSSRWVWGST
jgi:putative flippase GtrA